MRLNIRNPDAHKLATELARESLSKAVTEALRERLERQRQRRDAAALSAELLAIGRRCVAHITRPAHSWEHGDLLYDGQGLLK
jgi:antitoxin VapB